LARKKANGAAGAMKEKQACSEALHRMGFGYFGEKGELVISELEKRYIAEKGIAKIRGGKFPARLEDAYAVYRYFRIHGHVVRQASDDEALLRVWARGVGREEGRSGLLVKVVEVDWKADFDGLQNLIALAHAARKELVIARVVDGKVDLAKLAKFAD
jgi:tRNA splicing endonuclease